MSNTLLSTHYDPIRLLTAVHADLAALAFARRAAPFTGQLTMRSLVLEIGFSCIQSLSVPGVYDYVGSQLGLAIAPSPVWPSPCIHKGRHPRFTFSKLNTLPADALCLRFDDGLTTATARLKVRWFATPFL